MTSFDDRERAFEGQYARAEEMAFLVVSRRDRLVAIWAAARMGLDAAETEAYAKAVIEADFEERGDGDVIRKLLHDLIAAGISIDEAGVRAALADADTEARRQLLGDR